MVLQKMVPWRKDREGVDIRRDEELALPLLQRRVNRLFDDFFGDFGFPLSPFSAAYNEVSFFPKMDITETDKEITVTAELAGMDRKDVDISIDDNGLTIKGEKKSEHEQKDANQYLAERTYGKFTRTIALPADIERDKIEAAFKKGVLTIKLPKSPEEKNVKHIEVKGE